MTNFVVKKPSSSQTNACDLLKMITSEIGDLFCNVKRTLFRPISNLSIIFLFLSIFLHFTNPSMEYFFYIRSLVKTGKERLGTKPILTVRHEGRKPNKKE